MKTFIQMTFVVVLSAVSAFAASVNKTAKKVEMDLDRVWTFNFEELSKLPDAEKADFAKSFVQEAQSNIVLKKIPEIKSEDTFKPVIASEEKWNKVATKINNFCQDSHNYADCEKLSKVRKDLIIKNSSHR